MVTIAPLIGGSLFKEIKMEGYNGWRNRETWVVNLWCGELFTSLIDDHVASTGKIPFSDEVKEILTDYWDEFIMSTVEASGVIKDLIADHKIDWDEIAENILEDNDWEQK